MKTFKLGIDLATRNIGVCLLDANNNFVSRKTIELEPFSFEGQKLANNIFALTEGVADVLWETKKKFGLVTVDIGIELSNFKNAQYTNRFNFYAGALHQYIVQALVYDECGALLGCSFKFFNANQWEYKCGSRPKDERDRRKKNTRNFVMNHCDKYHESWTEDECDAFCIAYWLDELKNTDELHEAIKAKKRDKNKKTWVLYSLERKLNSRLAELASLDKVRNARRIETVKRIIENIKKEIEDVKKKTNNSTNLQ